MRSDSGTLAKLANQELACSQHLVGRSGETGSGGCCCSRLNLPEEFQTPGEDAVSSPSRLAARLSQRAVSR